ncbi:hypothetical protein M3172_04760 [Mesobacillus subterraneus]|uniref:hypothetical protein n=1 Tax=Mesobacillus subterraneus TaxID=285983 RepID=UPI00203C798B|nr:hypothetical protein [Mesobacillus subterraneus]MCM3572489.1 hypothetical protein [Mesobacillus subterraneus]
MSDIIEGKGKFIFGEEIEVEGDFTLNGDVEGVWNKNNSLTGSFDETFFERTLRNDLPFFPWDFEGETIQGKKILGKGMALTKQGENFTEAGVSVNWGFNINEIAIGDYQECEFFEYWIPNFIIGFDEMTQVGERYERNKTSFPITFNQETILVELWGINNLTTQRQEIRQQNEDLFTVKIILRKESGLLSIDEANDVIDLMLDLCSVAYGGRVTWGTCVGYSNATEVIRRIRSVSFAPLNPNRQLIMINHRGYLSQFIQVCLPSYSQLPETSRDALKKLMEGIQLSASKLIFPIPFIVLGSAVEEFAGFELAENQSHYIERAERRRISPSFRLFLEENVFPLIDENDIGDFDEGGIKQKLSGLLARNLRSRITNLLEQFEVTYNAEWIRDFVRKRNEAAHGNYDFSSADYYIWSRTAGLLEQVIFKKLQYQGPYYDWSTSPPEWRNPTN